MRFADIGGGNIAASSRVLCVASADSAPIRRMMQEARDRSMLVDCCAGKKCRSVLIMDSDYVVTSALEVAAVRKSLEE
ncbi:MAG: DUF370 domain-containing protein [Clostridiales bacterium]|nr:DUF370 domain-containing protein [Clostridiales bacterium]